MNYLTAEQVVLIHAFVVDETGGLHGVRDLGLLESAVARPQATFEGEDLHPNLFIKAAALLHALIQNHPFVDGNKRTGAMAAILFLEINGYYLNAKNKELESFALRVAVSKPGLSEIADGLRRKSE